MPKGVSPLHFHQHITEDYYVFSGKAHITIDGTTRVIAAGGHIRILPKQRHQVLNQSEEQPLHLLTRCVPAWTQADHILVMDVSQHRLD